MNGEQNCLCSEEHGPHYWKYCEQHDGFCFEIKCPIHYEEN